MADKRYKRRLRSAIFLLFLLCKPSAAGFEDMTPSARLAAVAEAGVALSYGADCIFSNPAAIGHAGVFNAHLFCTKPFGLDILLANCAMSYSHQSISGAVGVQSFGNSIYHENQFLASVAYRFFSTLTLGATCRLATLAIQQYGQSNSMMVDIGGLARFSPKVWWGFSIKNASNSKIGVAREPLPNIMTTGFCLKPRSNVALLFDLCKETRFPLDVRCGVDYSIFSPLTLRVGVGSEPTRFCAGFAISILHIKIDYGFSSHIELGLTHLFSIGVF